jgi:hypothetical protein
MEITQSDSTNIDSAEKMEPEWKSLFPDPDEEDQLPMICGHRAIVYQNFYYVIQGFDGGYTSDCYRYALERKEWMPFYPVTIDDTEDLGWQYHSTVLDGHLLYIFGGARDDDGMNQQLSNDVSCIDLRSSIKYTVCKNGLIRPRYLHTAAIYDKKMWIFGGRTGEDAESLNDLFCFDFETKTWKELNPTTQPPAPRRAHTSFVYDDKMYIFGGWNGVECFNDMWYYDFDLNKWFEVEQKGSVPSEREIECNAEYGGEFYIFGGASNGKQDNTLYAFNPVSSTWRLVETKNNAEARESHVLVPYKNKLILHGGFSIFRLRDLHLIELPIVEHRPTNLFEKFQEDMRSLYKKRNKEAYEQLLRLRCPHLGNNIIAFDNPSPVEEVFLEWLFTDCVDEEKFPFQIKEAQALFGEVLNWARKNIVEGLANWLLNFVTRNLNHENYTEFLQYTSEPVIIERCEYVHGHQGQETSTINDSNFIYPYYSTLQEDMLKLMKIEPDVVLELPNLVTMPLHSWIVDQRCPYFKGSIDFTNSLNAQRAKIIKHGPRISTSALESILKYVYSGKLEFAVEDYFDIVKEASYYMIDDELFYSAMSEEFMKRVTKDNKMTLLELVKKYEGNFLGELQYLQEY